MKNRPRPNPVDRLSPSLGAATYVGLARRKPQSAADEKKAAAGPALPDRRTMEAYLAAIAGGGRDDAVARAQEVMYDAWDKTSPEVSRSTWPLLGVSANQALHARTAVLVLLKLGEDAVAMKHFRAMLRLNPNDNQGVRYLLLGNLLRRDDIPAEKTLLPDEWSVYWLYTRALIAYRENRASAPGTLKLLKHARSTNEHLPPFSPAPSRPCSPAAATSRSAARTRRPTTVASAASRGKDARSRRMACKRNLRQADQAQNRQTCPLAALSG